MLFGESDQFVCAHHRAVIGHDFAAEPCRLQPGQTRQVDGGFGVAVASEHAVVHCFQRENVAGSAEIFGLGIILYCLHDGQRAFEGRDAGGRLNVVDGDGEGCPMIIGVAVHHRSQHQFLGECPIHRHTD